MTKNTCCFIGHRTIKETYKLKLQLLNIIENLIETKNVDTFLFGSKSQFNDFCHNIITQLKEKYPHIKRVYVRAEYNNISDSYKRYLFEFFEETYYPTNIIGSGKAIYIKRNYEMIKSSHYCIFYYDKNHQPIDRKSGTKIAFDYAQNLKKNIFRLSGTE